MEGVYEFRSKDGERSKPGKNIPLRLSKCLIFLQFQGTLRADFIPFFSVVRCTDSFKEELNIPFCFFIPCLIGMFSHKIAEPFCVTL